MTTKYALQDVDDADALVARVAHNYCKRTETRLDLVVIEVTFNREREERLERVVLR